MTGVGVSYSSTNSDRLRSPMLLPGLWNQDNQSQSSHGNNGVHSSYNSAPDVSRMKPFPSHDRP